MTPGRQTDSISCIEVPAKVNLYLHVTGRRRDGYHELDSLLVRIALCDRLSLCFADADRLEVTGPFARELGDHACEDNLVMRAVEAARRACGSRQPFHVGLQKNIPVAAGLGGGSADAAAVLTAVPAMLGCRADRNALAVSLGADVMACLDGRPVLVAGIGDVLEGAPGLPRCAAVLARPRRLLPTRAVFERHAGPFTEPLPLRGPVRDFDHLVRELGKRRNDLEDAACVLDPEIGAVLDALRACPGISLARMSGSGATCMGLAPSLDEARRAAAIIRKDHPCWWIDAFDVRGA